MFLPLPIAALFSLATVVTAACSGINLLKDCHVSTAASTICGSEPTPEAVAEAEALTASLIARDDCVDLHTRAVDNFVVPVYFHVISQGVPRDLKTSVSDEDIEKQILVLNQDFDGTGLSFKLMETTRTENQRWFDYADANTTEDKDMRATLRKGDTTALNVYVVGITENTQKWGYTTFPWEFKSNTKGDGVGLNYRVLPGGSFPNKDKGHALTHEVGHWVGLYHTFQGENCTGDGDLVDDTPPEACAARECKRRKSCPDGWGEDPIHNYMDYTGDDCVKEFTPGQIERLRIQIRCHRGINLTPRPQGRESNSLFGQVFSQWFQSVVYSGYW